MITRRSGTWVSTIYGPDLRAIPIEGLGYIKKTATVLFYFEALQNIYYAEDLLRTGVGGAKTELFINDKTFSEEVITETVLRLSRKFSQTAQEADRS
ncbi:hypothetical protein EVAR_38921_1 [Eumeta japonica]|uniref:Uncharacterized protein n=1 Tax=Eumeta variegata TaxID=151549 RepID=A0A4C1ZTQ2_EUMVA|nr:hypothetical protein EVAR_38921_1 [Eumeta japonica]